MLPPLIVFNSMNTKNSAPDAPFPMIFWQSAVLFLFSLGLMQRIVLSLLGQESDRIIIQFCLYIITVLSLQIAICWFIARRQVFFVPKWRDSRRIFAAALTLNLLGLLLSYTIFTGFFWYWRLLILAALFLVFGEIFIRAGRAIFIGLTLLCLSFNIETGFQIWQKTRPYSIDEDNKLRAPFFAKFKDIKFSQKPNIYFISWDALIPESIAAKYLDISPGEVAYANFVNNNDFRVFKNAFRDRGTYLAPNRELDPYLFGGTTILPNQMLILDPNMWEVLPGTQAHIYRGTNNPGQFGYFAGTKPSPVYKIFKDNGYKIITSADGHYLGKKGDYVDKFINIANSLGQCEFALEWYHLQSLGFCEYFRLLVKRDYLHVPDDVKLKDFAPHMLPSVQVPVVLPELQKNAQSGVPWLSFIYIWSPGHAPKHYQPYSQFHRQSYQKIFLKRTQETAAYMTQFMNMIRTVDPGAIVLFFGDHGQFLSINLTKNDMKDENKKRFHFLDSHAVMAALYPKNACAEYMNFAGDYVTISMLVRALIVCLADGDDPIDWEVDYSQPYNGIRFADYLYE